jgi:nucleoid-associated protein YgaU
MTTAADFVKRAKKYLGAEGRPNTFTRWYAKTAGPAFLGAAWCAMFVSYVASASKVKGAGKFAYCPYWVKYFKEEKRWGSTPKPGAIVFFDWNDDNVADHVGIVEYAKGGYIYTIEGNKGDKVARVVRKPGDILGYGYPVFSESKTRSYTVKPGDSLSKISVKYYADPSRWRDIYAANRKLIGSDPSLIKVGQKLNLPT